MWFVANCSSMPSLDMVRSGRAMMPALLMRMSSTSLVLLKSAAASRTALCTERSRVSSWILLEGNFFRMVVETAWMLVRVREARMSFLGWWAAMETAVYSPMLPGLTPVIKTITNC